MPAPDDPVAYARDRHQDRPAVLALLDEVERSRQRRASRADLPAHYTPHGGERRPLRWLAGEQED